ncbi:hypothetical protein E4U32_002229 [Claviceps aff. humidiphila group G2b]|nr:hypothetical protein E4U32_002229 [Claviceps aff. humidiphila group G2b]
MGDSSITNSASGIRTNAMPDGYSTFRLNYTPPAPKDSQLVRAQMEQCMAVIGTETQARRDGTEPMSAANAQERAPSGNSQPSQSELCKTTSTEVTAAKQASEIPSFINKSYRRDTPYLRARRNNAKRRRRQELKAQKEELKAQQEESKAQQEDNSLSYPGCPVSNSRQEFLEGFQRSAQPQGLPETSFSIPQTTASTLGGTGQIVPVSSSQVPRTSQGASCSLPISSSSEETQPQDLTAAQLARAAEISALVSALNAAGDHPETRASLLRRLRQVVS